MAVPGPAACSIVLLYMPGCPSWRHTKARLMAVLADLGDTRTTIEYREVTTVEEALRQHFRGSPTLLIDGHDPFADADNPVALGSRVYFTESGPAATPSITQLREVLTPCSL